MSSAAAAGGARLATPSIFTRTIMLGIMGTLSAYLASWENADMVRDVYLDKNRDHGDTFDFIIIGAGTAGAIVANRLSEKYKVLLLEAGGEPHPFQAVPLLSNYLLNYAQLDWRHVTMPQKQAFKGSVQNRASISQGRGLGGSSNIDYMMYLRGHPKDFDNWAELVGDPDWSYKSVEEYFKSYEQYSGPWAPENHGDSGELNIRPPAFTGLGGQFCEAAEANGYRQTDLNSFYSEGCDIINYPSKRGYRDSVHSSFLKRIKDRWNLAIHKYAHVNKILIRGNNDTAYGVEYDRHGKSRVAYAKKEIIVAAGAIQTPKILMLSGIGPKADLDSSGIPVKADLPVGKNLQDHLSVYLGPFFVEKGRSLDIDRDVSTGSVLSLAKDGGPLTTTGFQAATIVSSGLEKLHGGRNWPDLQLTMYGLAHHKSVEEDLNHAYRLKKDLLKTYLEHSKGLDSFSIVVSGGRPKSTGTVKLLNRNPYAPLIINPNYLDKIYDVVVMVDGVKKALRLVENSTVFYDDLNARFTRQILPGCEGFRFRSDAYFECYVRTLSVSLGNVAGTVPMGTVLNSKLQVKGIKSLRVMDASIMPTIVTTSTAATVMMIAEKGADMLLKEYEGASSEAVNLKDTNQVVQQIKEGSPQIKLGLDSSKALLESLKLPTLAGKQQNPPLGQFNFNDLQKLTKSVGSLASILDPVMTSESIQKNAYASSLNLGTAGGKTIAAIASLTPRLKSQFGGLYQNLFEDGGSKQPVKVNPGDKSQNGILGNSDLNKLLTGALGSALDPSSDVDPLKLIQNMMASMKELENITAMTSAVGDSLKSINKNNMTLEDIFGIADGEQDALEEYDIEDILNMNPKAPAAKSTTTRKPSKSTEFTSTTSKTTTSKPPKITYATTTTAKTTTTRQPYKFTWSTTTTAKSTTTTKTTTPKSVSSTSKRPFIDYSYTVLPVPLTPSKDISHSASQQITKVNSVSSNPAYHNSVKTIQIQPTLPIPLSNVHTFKVPPVPGPSPDKKKTSGPELQKIKNLEALAQIQHETLSKLRQKQQPRPRPQFFANPPNRPLPFPSHSFQNPPPPPSHMHPHQVRGQYSQFQHPQGQPAEPSTNILPPPFNGRHPSPMYYQQYPGGPPPPLHPLYDQMLKPGQPYPNQRPQGVLGQPSQAQPTVDPTNLKYAVHSIMNAKYAPPSGNPFSGIVNFFSNSHGSSTENSDVLKSMQLRANVEKYLSFPFSQVSPSPIPITHRPTPPPTTTVPPTRPPPPPLGPEQLARLKQQQEEDGGIFAPIKDVLQPLTKFMKAPLSLLPNPFKSESSKKEQSFLPSFLSSDIFQHRLGPLNQESSETPTIPSPSSHQNSLSVILPRLLMNQSKINGDMSPELFLLALANVSTELPKPFVLQPSKSFAESLQSQQSLLSTEPVNEKGKKLLDESITDILNQLKNHHFANVISNLPENPPVEEHSSSAGHVMGINSANEILNLDYKRVPTTVKSSVFGATPKVTQNPPIEFHKSPWAKEPPLPSKSLSFRIKIVKNDRV